MSPTAPTHTPLTGAQAFQPAPCPPFPHLAMGWCVVRNIAVYLSEENVCLLYKRKSLDTLAEGMQNFPVRCGQLHVEYLPVQCCVVECPCSFLACVVAFPGPGSSLYAPCVRRQARSPLCVLGPLASLCVCVLFGFL
jgi:hypothetical protein